LRPIEAGKRITLNAAIRCLLILSFMVTPAPPLSILLGAQYSF
jgi:hypothetical protein